MRKKSHLSLAGQIMDSLQLEEVFDYRLPFYVGNIWPDCRPSFITTPHTYDGTYHKLEESLEAFVQKYDARDGMNMRSCAKLGVMIHYIADYFTFPHNSHYDGNVKDHCIYERDLKHGLKSYLTTQEAMDTKKDIVPCTTMAELTSFIKDLHSEYVAAKRSVEEDIRYIVCVSTTVVLSLITMISHSFENLNLRLQYI